LPCTSLVLGTFSLPALHLLGAWPASCCNLILFKWPCLLALAAGFGLVVIIPPWCSAHEQGELCKCCWLWLLTVMCVICGVRYCDGCVAVLVVLLVD
jgi:hypothetical protein